MSYLKQLFAAGAAATVLATVGQAQTGATDNLYDSNWAPMHRTGLNNMAAFSGPGLFGAIFGDGHYAGFGDSIRRCYGVDTTQGGRQNFSGPSGMTFAGGGGDYTGFYEVTWLRLSGAYQGGLLGGPPNTFPGVSYGLVSILGSSKSSLGADSCTAPFFAGFTPSDVGGMKVTFTTFPFVLGIDPGTIGFPFPFVHETTLEILASAAGRGDNVIGLDATSVPGGFTYPLLANVIFEIQGPVNGGPDANQYFLATTTEVIGLGAGGFGMGGVPGGVTNGNLEWGTALFGAGNPPSQNNWVANSRVFSVTLPILVGTSPFAGIIGSTEFVGELAFQTPQTWATKVVGAGTPYAVPGSVDDGSGGPDWSVGNSVSTVDLRLMDNYAAGENTWRLHGNGPGDPAFVATPFPTTLTSLSSNPAYVWATTPGASPFWLAVYPKGVPPFINFAMFFWSTTPLGANVGFPQTGSNSPRPFSWKFFAGGVPGTGITAAEPGGFFPIPTRHEGNQRLAVLEDSTWSALFSIPAYTNGTLFSASDDITVDGPLYAGAYAYPPTSPTGVFPTQIVNQVFQGNFDAITRGISTFNTFGPIPVLGAPDPTLVGARFGLNGVTISLDVTNGNFPPAVADFKVGEVGSALTVTFQP